MCNTDIVPDTIWTSHEETQVKSFVEERIHSWHDGVIIKVPLSCGCGPLIDWVSMCEFVPKENHKDLKIQLQYVTDADGVRQRVNRRSPCLALQRIGKTSGDFERYNKFIDEIIDHDLDNFTQKYYEGKDEFAVRSSTLR